MPLHSFLICFYAVLTLFSENISEVSVNVIWRLLVVLTLCTGILLILLRGFTKDWQKSGLILSYLLLLFLTYGHLYNFLKGISVDGFYIFRHRYLTIIWLILGVSGTILIYRIKTGSSFSIFANTMSVIILVFPVYDIGLHISREYVYSSTSETQTTSSLHLPVGQQAPDVYFIVLDAYGRADVLLEVFGLDNSGFIRELENMGFYVVPCSQSNYARTRLSIASTLNMDYIQNLAPDLQADEVSFWVKPYLLNGQVRTLFEELGYETVAFSYRFKWLNWQNADYFLQPGEKSSIQLQLGSVLTPFEELFLNTTFARALIDLGLTGAQASSAPSHREFALYMLDTLPKIPKISAPKFIYAHLVLPHPPFVFGPNGEEMNIGMNLEEMNDVAFYEDEVMRAGFHDQTLYTNRRIVPILRSIIQESPVPPVIVLESDHGPTGYGGAQNRMANFMAYYFPAKDASRLAYSSITPVNSFRLVFNTYFGGNYPLVEDISYFSPYTSDLDYEIIPNTCAQE
jgi:hypothetical protein